MVEVFKTNVTSEKEAMKVLNLLEQTFKHHTINFDLEDRDNILRLEGKEIDVNEVIEILGQAQVKDEVFMDNPIKTIKMDGIELYTESFGNEKDQPILLLAGATISMLFWDAGFCQRLASRFFFSFAMTTGMLAGQPIISPKRHLTTLLI